MRREALIRMAAVRISKRRRCAATSTRGLRKVADGEVDAAILAAAGIVRLGRATRSPSGSTPWTFVPPPGQGAIALESAAIGSTSDWLAEVDHADTRRCVEAERAFMRDRSRASCDVPLGALGDDSSATRSCASASSPSEGRRARTSATRPSGARAAVVWGRARPPAARRRAALGTLTLA